jgi:hypothetical protein
MITLATGNTIQGVAGTATAITYTILGMELNGTTEVYKVLAQGQLAAAAAAIYTVPASNVAMVKTIILTNATGSPVSGVILYINGTAAANQMTGSITMPAGSTLHFNQNGWKVIDNAGNITNTFVNPKVYYNLPAAVATSGTGETLLFKCMVPAGYAVVGTTFRITVTGNSSSTGTLIFRVRVGSLGSVSDNQAWICLTSAAQVANQRAGADVIVTVRSTIAAIADGVAWAQAAQLPTVVGAPATAAIAVANAWYIDVDCTCSVGTFTAQVGTIEEVK